LKSPETKIRITLLGNFSVVRTNQSSSFAITIKSKKGKALLAFLALHLGRPVSRARVASLLWPDHGESMGRQNLRQLLAELRADIGSEFSTGITKDALQLNPANFSIDAIEFAALGGSANSLAEAVSLYHGDLTADFDVKSTDLEDWFLLERRKLHNLAADTFDAHITALLESGKQKQALAVCERLVAIDPLREATHRQLLLLDAAINGRASAIARAALLKEALSGELGIAPEPATLEVIKSLSQNHNLPSPYAAGTQQHKSPANRPTGFARFAYVRFALAALAALGLGGTLFYSGVMLRGWNARESERLPLRTLVKNTDSSYSIAIMPFTVRVESDELKRFASSLEEDVIDSLSRVPRFLVISRQTSRSYRDTNKDAREIGRELNVEFLLGANVQSDADKLVVRAQLIETKSGVLVWSDRFEYYNNSDQFTFEEIVLGVSRELQVQVIFTEATRRAKLERDTPTYGDLVQRATAAAIQSFSQPESLDTALQLYEQALTINAKHGAARIGLASVLLRRIAEYRSADRAKDLGRAVALLESAIKDLPDSSAAHFFLGIARKMQSRFSESVGLFEKAIRLNPSNAHAYAQLGHTFIFLGRTEEVLPHIQKAIRLSPRDPTISSWYLFAGYAELHLRHYDESIGWFRRSVDAYSRSGRAQLLLATAYLLKGDSESAAQVARLAVELLPEFRVESLGNLTGDAHPKYIAEQQHIRQAMRDVMKLGQQK
jgi:DNA-binding SARP family transcriptional activator/TolB-like protein/cytochrome c-type biogenesis protein CcmH/NrfG